MRERWPLVPLAEVLNHDRNYIDRAEPKLYPKLSVKLYGKGVALDAPADGATLRMQRHQLAKAGQVILSEIWGKKGAIGIVPPQGEGSLCTSHFFLFDVRRDQIDPGYLQAVFSSNYLESQLGSEAKGTTGYAAVRPQHLLAACIPLPPLPEQRRIASLITEISTRVAEADRLRLETNAQIDSLWASAASRFFTSTDGTPLRDLVTVRGGGTPSKQIPAFWDGRIPWVSPKDMKGRTIRNSVDHISAEALSNSSARLIEPPAVLIVTRGMILARVVPVAVLEVPAAINQDLKALVPNQGVLSEYLCNALLALNESLLALVEKSTHDTRKLQTERLLEVRIPVLPIHEQQRITASLTALHARLDCLRGIQSEEAAAFDSLLPSVIGKALLTEGGDESALPSRLQC